MHLKPPLVTHTVEVLLLGLEFHTEYPNGVSDVFNIFMSPYFSLEAGSKAAMIAWRWDTALESITLMSYSKTAALLNNYHILSIIRWEGTPKILGQCLLMLNFLIGPLHPTF